MCIRDINIHSLPPNPKLGKEKENKDEQSAS
jgi:hypothetical protein